MTALSNSRATSDTPNADNALATAPRHKTTPWWLEMIRVDFRHGLWPWIAINSVTVLGFVFLADIKLHNAPIALLHSKTMTWVYGAYILFAPGIVALIASSNNYFGTTAALLTFPVSRTKLWLVRLIILFVTLFSPIVIAIVATYLVVTDTSAFPTWALHMTMTAWCYFCFGYLFATLLKRPLLAWSATLISVFFSVLLFSILNSLPGISMSMSTGSVMMDAIKVLPDFFWFNLIIGLAALLAAWRLWLRLEVR